MLLFSVFVERGYEITHIEALSQTTVKAKYVIRIDSGKYCEGNQHVTQYQGKISTFCCVERGKSLSHCGKDDAPCNKVKQVAILDF